MGDNRAGMAHYFEASGLQGGFHGLLGAQTGGDPSEGVYARLRGSWSRATACSHQVLVEATNRLVVLRRDRGHHGADHDRTTVRTTRREIVARIEPDRLVEAGVAGEEGYELGVVVKALHVLVQGRHKRLVTHPVVAARMLLEVRGEALRELRRRVDAGFQASFLGAFRLRCLRLLGRAVDVGRDHRHLPWNITPSPRSTNAAAPQG